MGLVVPDQGEVNLLDAWVAGDSINDWFVWLFKNNYTPTQDSLIGNFTVADFSGFASVAVNFGAAAILSHKGTLTGAAPCVFTHNGGGTANTIYGYYIAGTATTDLLWAERFTAPIVMGTTGDLIGVTLSLTANSEN